MSGKQQKGYELPGALFEGSQDDSGHEGSGSSPYDNHNFRKPDEGAYLDSAGFLPSSNERLEDPNSVAAIQARWAAEDKALPAVFTVKQDLKASLDLLSSFIHMIESHMDLRAFSKAEVTAVTQLIQSNRSALQEILTAENIELLKNDQRTDSLAAKLPQIMKYLETKLPVQTEWIVNNTDTASQIDSKHLLTQIISRTKTTLGTALPSPAVAVRQEREEREEFHRLQRGPSIGERHHNDPGTGPEEFHRLKRGPSIGEGRRSDGPHPSAISSPGAE